MNQKSGADYTIAAFTISIVLAVAVSVAVCQLVLGAVNLWIVIGVAAVSCLVAGFGAGTLVEGIVITIIIGILGLVAASSLTSIYIPAWLSQVLLSASIGICTGSLVLGTYYEFFSPAKVWDDSPTENPPRQDSRRENAPHTGHKQSNVVLQEYDTVRVARLHTADREFDGTEGICRPPAIGDVAVIAHEYEPDDPTASVAVEMVDDEGYTVWLAGFDRNELEFVHRPEKE